MLPPPCTLQGRTAFALPAEEEREEFVLPVVKFKNLEQLDRSTQRGRCSRNKKLGGSSIDKSR